MTRAIKGSSTERFYEELGIEHLRSRRWFKKLCLFYKILKNKSPPYLFNLIPSTSRIHTVRNSNNTAPFKVTHNFFKNYFFPSVTSERNKLDFEIYNSASLEILKKHLLNYIRSNSNNVFRINKPLGLKSLTRLRIGFSHLKENKFKQNFQNSMTLCVAMETTLLKKLKSINGSILAEIENTVVRRLLFGRPNFTD